MDRVVVEPAQPRGWLRGSARPAGGMTVPRFGVLVTGLALAAFALRIRFVAAGISMDEGGYLYVAWRWAHGAALYSQVWIDRPQGLILLYRLTLAIANATWPVRLLAAAFGAIEVVLIALVVRRLADERAALIAAGIYVVIGCGIAIEGYTLNGELAASVPSTAAIACALYGAADRRVWPLPAAGLLAAVAVMMKPSGFDGLIVAAVVVAVGYRRGAVSARAAALFVAGLLIPIGAGLLQATTVGLGTYWTDVAGWRLAAHNGGAAGWASRYDHLVASWRHVRADIGVLAAAAAVGLVASLARRSFVLAGWLVAAFAGMSIGALYWPHYWVQLVPPIAALAGVGIGRLRGLVAPALATLAVIVWPAATLAARLSGDAASFRAQPGYAALSLGDERVGAFLSAHSSARDTVFVLISRPDVYFYAHRVSSYPYLWQGDIIAIAGAVPLLRASMLSASAPRLIAWYNAPSGIDQTGQLGRIIARHYRFLACVPKTSVGVLERRAVPVAATSIDVHCP